MRKKYVVSAIVGMSLCVASVAVAFDGESMASRTTMSMYDNVDPFDLSTDEALLYQIERWRLYTNASGYEDGNSYLIGTSGKLGPGSLAAFFETNSSETVNNNNTNSLFTLEAPDGDPFVAGPNPFDGVDDLVSRGTIFNNSNSEWQDDGYYAAYSMDFGVASLGLGVNIENGEASGSSPDSGSRTDTTLYDPANHNIALADMTYSSNSASWDDDEDNMRIILGSHYRMNDKLGLRAYLAYLKDESDYNERSSSNNTSTTDVTGGSSNGYQDHNSNIYASNENDNTDLDGWGIRLAPTYKINDNLMIRCDLFYADMNGDSKRNTTSTRDELISEKASASAPTIISLDRETDSYTIGSGDDESRSYSISPRLYFTYGAAQFSLGVTYENDDEEFDGTQTGRSTIVRKVYNPGTGDLFSKSETVTSENRSISEDNSTETWSFPIGTLVKLTDKWTFRAGAAFTRVKQDNTTNTGSVYGYQDVTTTYDAAGAVIGYRGDTGYVNADGDWVPYNTTESQSNTINNYKREFDYTTYRLGLGYLMTENVNLDLMFEGNSGAVSTDSLYASITYAF